MDVLFSRTHRNTIRLLNLAGYDVEIPERQGCCGALHAHGGNLSAAREAARKNVRAFEVERFDAVVVNAAGCGSTLKEYGHLLAGDGEWSGAGMAFAAKVRDLTEVLSGAEGFLAKLERSASKQDGLERVTCHDACHLFHAQRVVDAPRKLVRAVAGERYVELPESEICCGSAGTYNLTEPEMARRLQEPKVRQIESLGPVTVVTTNPGCLMQIRAGLRAAGLKETRIVHIADWLAGELGLNGGDACHS
jgi:glycolate oxidase iron-sulfur subunit